MAVANPAQKRLHKSEILALCQECSNQLSKGCIMGDLEASAAEYRTIPECFSDKKIDPPTNEKNRPTNEKNRPINEGINRPDNEEKFDKNSSHTPKFQTDPLTRGKNDPPPNEKSDPHQYVFTQNGKIKITELDIQILELAIKRYHPRLITKTLNQPWKTVRNRINRLEKAGLITPYQGAYNTKLYHVSTKLTDLLIHNEDKPLVTPFTAHCMSFKFPILEGTQPRSSKAFKMTNWTGYVFDDHPDYVIRTTPKNIIVDVRQDLGADSIDDLNLKYSQLAQSYAYKFAEKHQLILGGIAHYREAHFTIEDTALGQIVSERGEIRTKSGIMIDKSRSSGDIEMKEETARAFEYTINQFPITAANIESELKGLKDQVAVKLDHINSDIGSIQKWLYLEKENRLLRDINEKLTEQIELLKKQIHHLPDEQKKPTEGGMYG
jgi:hypothetical protein